MVAVSVPAFAFDRDCDQRNTDETLDLRALMQQVVVGKDDRCRMTNTNLGRCEAKKEDIRNRNVFLHCPGFPNPKTSYASGVMVSNNVVCTTVHNFLKDGEVKGSLSSCYVETQGKSKEARQRRTLDFGPNDGKNFKFPTLLPEYDDQAGHDIVCIPLTEKMDGISPVPIDFTGRLLKQADEMMSFAAFQTDMTALPGCLSKPLVEPIAHVCPKKEVVSLGQLESVAYGECDMSSGASGGPVYVCVNDQPVLVALHRDSGKGSESGLSYDRTNSNVQKRRYSQAVLFNENVKRSLEEMIGNVRLAKVPEGKPQRRQNNGRPIDI